MKEQEQTKINQVQAISTLEIPQMKIEGTPLQNPRVAMIANATYAVDFAYMWDDLLENHEGEINQAIKKFAANYYSSLSPTTIQSIRTKLGEIIYNSMSLFAAICCAWKYQNCNQFEDEDGRSLQSVLNNMKHAEAEIRAKENFVSKACDFGISNADWKKKVLKKLKSVYLGKLMKDFIWVYCGHFIDLDPDFEGTQRLVTFVPYSFMDQYGETEGEAKGKTAEVFYAYLDDLEETIDNAYNMYPFFDGLLEYLHLTNPGDEYNFTRDLAQMKLNLLKDTNGATADMIYMLVAGNTNYGDEAHEADFSRFSLVKTNIDGSYFEVYDKDNAAAKTLKYNDRVQINIVSVANALRGNFTPLNITEMVRGVPWLNVSGGQTGEGYYAVQTLNPYFLTTYLENLTAKQWIQLNDMNKRYYELGYPHDSITILINTLIDDPDSDPENVEQVINNARYTFSPSSGDYIISSDDIESVISDSIYGLVFDEITKSEPVVNTLGNNGNNK
jgi:hypothetical protein